MSVIDTPDGQRGFVNAQSLQGTFTPGNRAGNVGVPANAETLVVVVGPSGNPKTCQCVGLTSGINYPGILLPVNPNTSSGKCWQFDISQPLDATVSVSFNATPGDAWYVYADAGVHQVADMSKLTNTEGLQYTIPSAPNTAAGDHPSNELLVASATLAASGAFLAAPGANARYRVFGGQMGPEASGLAGQLHDATSNVMFLVCGGLGNQVMEVPLTGLALPSNAAINYTLVAGAGSMLISLFYTLEQI